MEIWDGYNIDGSLAGVDLVRGEKIPDGLYHLVCEVLVQHTDGDFLLMKRDLNKPINPGKYEATAGGSASVNFTKRQALWQKNLTIWAEY